MRSQAGRAEPPRRGSGPHPAATSGADGHRLVLEGITVRFGGVAALHNVSLTVPPSAVTGLIGPNGSGKTTLFNVVCGFVHPVHGTMAWQDRPFRPHPHRLVGLGIARTLQSVGLFHRLTVAENVMLGATHTARTGFLSALLALPRSDREERQLRAAAMTALERVGMAGQAEALPGTLPFALRKRVALARALVAEPRLLLLDEPASGLGDEDVSELAALLRTLPQQDVAVMVVEHRMDFVLEICATVAVLDSGRLIAHGPPDQIRRSAAVIGAYLGADPHTGPTDGPGSGA